MTVEQMAAEVADLMGERLHVSGASLAERIKRAGKKLPRKIRREAIYLSEAALTAAQPKVSRQQDQVKIAAAHAACVGYLRPLGGTARRIEKLRGVITSMALAVLATFALVVVVLVLRGYL